MAHPESYRPGGMGKKISDLCALAKIPMGLIQLGEWTPQQQWEDASNIMHTIANCAVVSLLNIKQRTQGTVKGE